MVGRDRDVGDRADRHAAELHGRADVETLHRLVEVADRGKRLALETASAEPEERRQHHEDADEDEEPELPMIGRGGRHQVGRDSRLKKARTRGSGLSSRRVAGWPRAMIPRAPRSSMMHASATVKMLCNSCVTMTVVMPRLWFSVKSN